MLYFFSRPLPTYHKQQQLLPYRNSEGTWHLTVISGGEPFESRCYNGQGLVVQWLSAIGNERCYRSLAKPYSHPFTKLDVSSKLY